MTTMSKKEPSEQRGSSPVSSDSTNQAAEEIGHTRDSVSHNWHMLDNRLSMIAEAAYFKAQRRGFEVGHDIADWLQAEQELAEIMGEAVASSDDEQL